MSSSSTLSELTSASPRGSSSTAVSRSVTLHLHALSTRDKCVCNQAPFANISLFDQCWKAGWVISAMVMSGNLLGRPPAQGPSALPTKHCTAPVQRSWTTPCNCRTHRGIHEPGTKCC
jgi:hypothetical protein